MGNITASIQAALATTTGTILPIPARHTHCYMRIRRINSVGSIANILFQSFFVIIVRTMLQNKLHPGIKWFKIFNIFKTNPVRQLCFLSFRKVIFNKYRMPCMRGSTKFLRGRGVSRRLFELGGLTKAYFWHFIM